MAFKISIIIGIYVALIFLLAWLTSFILSRRNKEISFWSVIKTLSIATVAGNLVSYLLYKSFIIPGPRVYWGEAPASFVWGLRIITFLPLIFIAVGLIWTVAKQTRQGVNNRA